MNSEQFKIYPYLLIPKKYILKKMYCVLNQFISKKIFIFKKMNYAQHKYITKSK